MDECKVMQVIYCTIKRKGSGHGKNPIRVITQIFTLDGKLLAEIDPHKTEPTAPPSADEKE